MKKYTGKILKGMLNELIDKYNMEYDSEIPYIDFDVKIVNAREYKGVYTYRIGYRGIIYPISLKFASHMFKNDDEKIIMDTIKHELAHYIVSIETNEIHEHDGYWEAVCRKLHMGNIEAEYMVTEEEYIRMHKYSIVDCMGNAVGYRDKLTKILRYQIEGGCITDRKYKKPCSLLENSTNKIVVKPDEYL